MNTVHIAQVGEHIAIAVYENALTLHKDYAYDLALARRQLPYRFDRLTTFRNDLGRLVVQIASEDRYCYSQTVLGIEEEKDFFRLLWEQVHSEVTYHAKPVRDQVTVS